MDYLLEIQSFKNSIVIIGFSSKTGLNFICFNESDLTINLNLSTTIKITPSLYDREGFNNFQANLSSLERNPFISKYSFYKCCKVNKDDLLIILPNNNFVELTAKRDGNCFKIVKNEFNLGVEYQNKIVNCVKYDKFKFLIAFDDNTIKLFSAKSKELWYNLIGGSMTIIPKSFVTHPNIVGFSNIIMTKSKIIGTIGNLIREYSFIQKFQ